MKGRLLETALEDPYSNVALEEAIFAETGGPTLRIWENQKSVVIGRAQKAEFETDLDLCRERSIPVVRRMTGGGAVYNGPGNLNWSFFVPGTEGGGTDAKGVFTRFAGVLVRALGNCGCRCAFVPPNGIYGRGGKVSGMAAFLSKRGTLCHGTLLISADLEEVEALTRPRPGSLPRRYSRSRFVEVSNCGVGRDPLVAELARESGYSFEPGELSTKERTRLDSLLGKYRSEEWNLGDPFG